MTIPLIDLLSQYRSLESEIDGAIKRVLESGVYINGVETKSFCSEISDYTGADFAIPTANGTDSLILSMQALNIGVGDEVITSPYSFFASAEAIARVGATPVFADIDPLTYNLCPEKVEKKITDKTKAVIPVHIFGQPADMDAFITMGKKHNLFIIEDACQALGARYKNQQAGTIGVAGCISFFSTKNLGGYGDGGLVLTNNEELAHNVQLLASHGSSEKYYHEVIGYNSRLDELQAAILRIKLKKLNEWNQKRREKAMIYSTAFNTLEITTPFTNEYVQHVFHLYIIQSKNSKKISDFLLERGIATGHYYPCPLHLQKAFRSLGYKNGDLPVAENLANHSLALPLFPELTNNQQQYIISCIQDFGRLNSRLSK
jgi:dTDP-4-amino-4,6-dideoxygalactose transaminase